MTFGKTLLRVNVDDDVERRIGLDELDAMIGLWRARLSQNRQNRIHSVAERVQIIKKLVLRDCQSVHVRISRVSGSRNGPNGVHFIHDARILNRELGQDGRHFVHSPKRHS